MKSYLQNTFNFVPKICSIVSVLVLTLSSTQLLAVTQIFITTSTNTGKYTDRVTADAICVADGNNDPQIEGNTVKALLSLSADDEIRDFPDIYNLDKIDEITQTNGLTISGSWDGLLGAASANLVNSFGTGTASYWTFSTTNGTLGGKNCSNGTSDGPADDGFGNVGITGSEDRTGRGALQERRYGGRMQLAAQDCGHHFCPPGDRLCPHLNH